MNTNQEKWLTAYKKIPKKVQDWMGDPEVGVVIEKLEITHNLDYDQQVFLAKEISMIMVGLVHPSQLLPRIQENLNLNREAAREVVKIISDQIFSPIRKELVLIHNLTPQEKKTDKKESGHTKIKSYSTSPELFEQKLKSSAIAQTKKEERHTIAVEDADADTPKPNKNDSYREPTI